VSMHEAAAAFRRGLTQPTAIEPRGPGPVKESATPEERLAEAVRLYDWQIRDLTDRLRGIRDPAEAARLHARITDARAKLDATQGTLAKHGGDVTQHPEFARAVGQYVEAVNATLEDVAGIGLDVADIPTEHVERVLRAARRRLDERLAALVEPALVNAADAAR
jgi:hypothetical protein